MFFPHFISSRVRFVASLVVLLSLVGVILTSWLPTHNAAEQRKNQEVETLIHAATDQLQITMELYIQTLYGARGLMMASQNVDRGEWLVFYQNIGSSKRLPGLAALGYLEYVSELQKAVFLQRMNDDTSYPNEAPINFSIHPDQPASSYQVLTYIEPMSALIRQNTLGLDFNSEFTRKTSLEKARDTNQPILSPPIRELDTQQPSLILFLPVYDHRLARTDVAQRRKAYTGAIILGFRTSDFFKHAFGNLEQTDLAVSVYDGEILSDEHLLYQSTSGDQVLGTNTKDFSQSIDSGIVTSTRTISVADRTWTLRYQYRVPKEPAFVIPTMAGRIAVVLVTNFITGLVMYHYLRLKHH